MNAQSPKTTLFSVQSLVLHRIDLCTGLEKILYQEVQKSLRRHDVDER